MTYNRKCLDRGSPGKEWNDMKMTGSRPDGSLDVAVEWEDGCFSDVLQTALAVAQDQLGIVHFAFNERPIAIGPETDLSLIERLYEYATPPFDEMGPYPDPEQVPELDHGVMVVTL